MKIRLGVRLVCTLWLGLCGTCDSQRTDPPPVQPSSDQVASSVVRIRAGQSFTASCLIVQTGTTVEWRNLTPAFAPTVVSTAVPYELSSPALREPYNFVPPESSDECVLTGHDGSCLAAVPFTFWRHTFTVPGIFDYHDTSGGTVAVQASSSYELPPGPQTSASAAAVGTICVRSAPGATDCDQVCCTGTIVGECAAGVTCTAGRCGGVN